jgi:hypothetical protein
MRTSKAHLGLVSLRHKHPMLRNNTLEAAQSSLHLGLSALAFPTAPTR